MVPALVTAHALLLLLQMHVQWMGALAVHVDPPPAGAVVKPDGFTAKLCALRGKSGLLYPLHGYWQGWL